MGDTEPYDAVILDLGLPKVDGISVLERWRKEKKNFPVLILTARDQWSDKVSGFDAECDDSYCKTILNGGVISKIESSYKKISGHCFVRYSWSLKIDTKSNKVFLDGSKLKTLHVNTKY